MIDSLKSYVHQIGFYFILLLLFVYPNGKIHAQKLGLYVGFNDQYVQEFRIDEWGFEALLLSDSVQSSVESQLTLFQYPKMSTDFKAENADSSSLFDRFQGEALRFAYADAFVGFHPYELMQNMISPPELVEAYFIERVMLYAAHLKNVENNSKKKWVIVSHRDIDRLSTSHDDKSSSIEAVLLKTYHPDDLNPKKLQHWLVWVDQINPAYIFIEQRFLLEASDQYPNLKNYLRALSRGERLEIPKISSTELPLQQFGFILLFVLMATFAIHYGLSYRYSNSLSRYVKNRRFFYQNLQSWRDRLSSSSMIVLMQFSLLYSLLLFALSSQLFSENGLVYFLSFYLPFELGPNQAYFYFYLLLNIGILLFFMGMLVWSNIWNTGFRHFGQSLCVHAYSMHYWAFLIIPAYLFLDYYAEYYWILGISLILYAALIPLNHLRAQFQVVQSGSNPFGSSILGGFLLFWVLIIIVLGILYWQTKLFTYLQFALEIS